MVNLIGIIGGVLLFIKFFLHIYLMSKVDNQFPSRAMFSQNSMQRLQTLLPFYANVPNDLNWLKIFTNIIYVTSVLLLMAFLIIVNIHK